MSSLERQIKDMMEDGAVKGINRVAHLIEEAAVASAPRGSPLRTGQGQFRTATEADHRPGTLKASAGRTLAVKSKPWAMVYFQTPYAAKQHEELGWKHPQGGKPKFLEDSFKAYIPMLTPEVAKEIYKEAKNRFG